MKPGVPTYVSVELQNNEPLITYIPEPDLPARRRIILAIFPLFAVVVAALVFFFKDGANVIAAAAGVYCAVAVFVFALRLCRTSYFISERRVVCFVGGKKVEDIELARSRLPQMLDFSASDFRLAKVTARFLSLGQTVVINRLTPERWTVAKFFSSRDPARMRIGYPGHSLSIARILDDVTLAWHAAQDEMKAAP